MSELDMWITDIMVDVNYLVGVGFTEIVNNLDDMDNLELYFTLNQMKTLILAKLMAEEDKS